MGRELPLLLEQARAARSRSDWAAARQLYASAAAAAPGTAHIHHNLALCMYAEGACAAAYEHAEIATRREPGLAQAWVLRAKIERSMDDAQSAAASLGTALTVRADDPPALLALAELTLNELGNAREAQRLVAPLLTHPVHGESAALATLLAKLYDRDESAEALNRQIVQAAERYLTLRQFRFDAQRPPRRVQRHARPRIGLMSPLFCASPVYFFTYGALAILAGEVDLVFFNRGTRSDWATRRLRALATEWYHVANLSAGVLANALYARDVDVLIDLGGWMDPVGLRALSSRPARRLYKWVGGQSSTTGLSVFDGFLADSAQVPADAMHLYREPLSLLEPGYVSYTRPDYWPAAPRRAPAGEIYAVIGNPAKISSDLLETLRRVAPDIFRTGGSLRFIDRRYRHACVRRRIRDGLRGAAHGARVRLIAPDSHGEYLRQVSRVTHVLDTAPYSGGLTTVEALALGVKCVARAGQLYCERHSFAHFQFCDGAISDWHLSPGGGWKVCEPRGSVRANHAGVAAAIFDATVAGARSTAE